MQGAGGHCEAGRILPAPLQAFCICLSEASYAKRLIIGERGRNPQTQRRLPYAARIPALAADGSARFVVENAGCKGDGG